MRYDQKLFVKNCNVQTVLDAPAPYYSISLKYSFSTLKQCHKHLSQLKNDCYQCWIYHFGKVLIMRNFLPTGLSFKRGKSQGLHVARSGLYSVLAKTFNFCPARYWVLSLVLWRLVLWSGMFWLVVIRCLLLIPWKILGKTFCII